MGKEQKGWRAFQPPRKPRRPKGSLPKAKTAHRELLESELEKFLADGGEVEVCPKGNVLYPINVKPATDSITAITWDEAENVYAFQDNRGGQSKK